MTKYDTDYTNYPVCPYCGHEHDDYVYAEGSEDYDCEACGEEFSIEPDVEITYTTSCKTHDYSDFREAKGMKFEVCTRCGAVRSA